MDVFLSVSGTRRAAPVPPAGNLMGTDSQGVTRGKEETVSAFAPRALTPRRHGRWRSHEGPSGRPRGKLSGVCRPAQIQNALLCQPLFQAGFWRRDGNCRMRGGGGCPRYFTPSVLCLRPSIRGGLSQRSGQPWTLELLRLSQPGSFLPHLAAKSQWAESHDCPQRTGKALYSVWRGPRPFAQLASLMSKVIAQHVCLVKIEGHCVAGWQLWPRSAELQAQAASPEASPSPGGGVLHHHPRCDFCWCGLSSPSRTEGGKSIPLGLGSLTGLLVCHK